MFRYFGSTAHLHRVKIFTVTKNRRENFMRDTEVTGNGRGSGQFTCTIILRCVRATIVAVEKQ